MAQALNRKNLTLPPQVPERIVQFGGGNFLRGFVGWIVQRLNVETAFNGSIVLVKATPGRYAALDEQDGLYHVHLEGIASGSLVSKTDLITCVSRTLYPYEDFTAYLALACQPEIQFIVSNTTENGIHYDAADTFSVGAPPRSFPALLTRFLYARYQHFNGDADKGCVILPTELIEHNGATLCEVVLRYAEDWGLGADFSGWITAHNLFCDTLVDRIVTGFPQDVAKVADLFAQIGFEDRCLVTGEPYHSWVIEGPESLQTLLPVHETDLNVTITDDAEPYRQTKVRILNGMHTGMVALGLLGGFETVRAVADDSQFAQFLQDMVYEEIIPSMDLPPEPLQTFAESAFDRLRNPYIQHQLRSIALNSIAKYRARLLPSLLGYAAKQGALPQRITLTLAALLRFYAGEWQGEAVSITDDPIVTEWFAAAWRKRDSLEGFVQSGLAQVDFWGQDLTQVNGLVDVLTQHIEALENHGAQGAISLLNEVK